MGYTLITDDELMALPFDVEGFVQYERICRSTFDVIVNNLRNNDASEHEAQMSYMSHVSNAAFEFGIPDAEEVNLDDYIHQSGSEEFLEFDRFDRIIHGIISKYQLRIAREKKVAQFALSDPDKRKIRHFVERLRQLIEESTLEANKKDALYAKLNDLLAELDGKKFDMGRAMIIITAALAIVSSAEADLINLPKAFAAIGTVIGQAKSYHDTLVPTLKQIEHKPEKSPAKRKPPKLRESFSSELDDEIPF